MLILTERTPNPDALKFLPHVRLTDGRSWTFHRRTGSADPSPLAERLFSFAPVRRVFIASDFVTVTREPTGEGWETLRVPILGALAEHLESGDQAVCAGVERSRLEEPVEAMIREILALCVGPTVSRDGGDVVFDRFDRATGTLWVRMEGACGGCPSARQTLKRSVERIVCARAPDVVRVEETVAVADDDLPEQVRAARLSKWRESIASPSGRLRTEFRHNGRPLPRTEP